MRVGPQPGAVQLLGRSLAGPAAAAVMLLLPLGRALHRSDVVTGGGRPPALDAAAKSDSTYPAADADAADSSAGQKLTPRCLPPPPADDDNSYVGERPEFFSRPKMVLSIRFQSPLCSARSEGTRATGLGLLGSELCGEEPSRLRVRERESAERTPRVSAVPEWRVTVTDAGRELCPVVR